MFEETPDAFLNRKLDLSKSECDYVKFKKQATLLNELIEAICDLEDPAFNNISIKAASADLPISTDVNIHSESIGSGIKIALKTFLKLVSNECAYVFHCPLDEIYHDWTNNFVKELKNLNLILYY